LRNIWRESFVAPFCFASHTSCFLPIAVEKNLSLHSYCAVVYILTRNSRSRLALQKIFRVDRAGAAKAAMGYAGKNQGHADRRVGNRQTPTPRPPSPPATVPARPAAGSEGSAPSLSPTPRVIRLLTVHEILDEEHVQKM
jgi:hypothetical protein